MATEYRLSYTASEINERLRSIDDKADKTAVSSPYNFKGSCAFSELPTTGNAINDTYYCTDVKTKYTWNGTGWYQSSLNESEYADDFDALSNNVGTLLNDIVDKKNSGVKYVGSFTKDVVGANEIVETNIRVDGRSCVLVKAPFRGGGAIYLREILEDGTVNNLGWAPDRDEGTVYGDYRVYCSDHAGYVKFESYTTESQPLECYIFEVGDNTFDEATIIGGCFDALSEFNYIAKKIDNINTKLNDIVNKKNSGVKYIGSYTKEEVVPGEIVNTNIHVNARNCVIVKTPFVSHGAIQETEDVDGIIALKGWAPDANAGAAYGDYRVYFSEYRGYVKFETYGTAETQKLECYIFEVGDNTFDEATAVGGCFDALSEFNYIAKKIEDAKSECKTYIDDKIQNNDTTDDNGGNELISRTSNGNIAAIENTIANQDITVNIHPTFEGLEEISDVTVCKSNIFNPPVKDAVEHNGVTWQINSAGEIHSLGTATDMTMTSEVLGEIQLPKLSEKVAVSVTLNKLPEGLYGGISNIYYDATGAWQGKCEYDWKNGYAIIDPTATKTTMYFYRQKETDDKEIKFRPVIEVGKYITSEEQYNGTNITSVVNFGRPIYGGAYNTGNGNLVETHIKYTIDGDFESKCKIDYFTGNIGSVNWTEAAEGSKAFRLNFNIYNDEYGASPAYEKANVEQTVIVGTNGVLTPMSADNLISYVQSQGIAVDRLGHILIYVDGITTVDALRTWLSANPVEIVVKRLLPHTSIVKPINPLKTKDEKMTILGKPTDNISFSYPVFLGNTGCPENFDSTPYKDILPVLYLDGNIAAMTKEKAVKLNYRYKGLTGTCDVKWQGSSSIAYVKKNFTIKFDNKFEATTGIKDPVTDGANLSIWGKQTKYCTKANWIDVSHARNIVSAKLWGKIVKSRGGNDDIITKLEKLPNGGAIDGYPIIIVINGEYQGLYTFNIPKDGWMFGMGDGEAEYILCAESHRDPENFKATISNPANIEDYFSIEYAPEIDDKGNVDKVAITESVNNLIQACINANADSSKLSEIDQYLDWNSAIDYYIFTCLVRGEDMTDKNYLIATYDGTKWFFSGYDMDSTWGLKYDGKRILNATQGVTFGNYASTHLLMKLIKTHKKDDLKARYAALRADVMSEDNVVTFFTNFIGMIPENVYRSDRDRWTGLPGTSVNNISQIADWYRRRVAFLDAEINAM